MVSIEFPLRHQQRRIFLWEEYVLPSGRTHWRFKLDPEVNEWVEENIRHPYKLYRRDATPDDPEDPTWERRAQLYALRNGGNHPIRKVSGIEFENETEAVHFKLRWY